MYNASGRLLGKPRTTSADASVPGLWTMQQQIEAKRALLWPVVSAIVTDGLVLHLDAGDSASYPGSGTTWTDLSGNGNDGTLVSMDGNNYSSANGGYLDFDGSSDYITLGTQINSDIQLTDVTISFWAYIDSTASDEVFVSMDNLNVNTPLVIWYDSAVFSNSLDNTGVGDVGGGTTNAIVVMVTDSSSERRFGTSDNPLSATTWHNISVVLDVTNNSFYTYIDGVEKAKWVSNNTSGGIRSTTNDFRIGGGSPYLDGRISNLLVYTKALTQSEITQNFNALMDRYLVSLLLRGDGTNGSTTIIDSSPSPKTVTVVGDAQISTAQSKFGGASMYFDGSGDYLTVPNSSAFDFGTGNFTVECWVYITSLANYHAIIEARSSATYQNYVLGIYNTGGVLRLDFVNSGGATNRSATTTSVPLNAWTHVAWVKSSGITSYYVNGIKDATTNSYSGSLTPNRSTLQIGSVIDPQYFHGYIDDLRITKGVARYTSNFTPPGAL